MPGFFNSARASPQQWIPRGPALPAHGELRLEHLAALLTLPLRRTRRRPSRCRFDQPPRDRLVALIDEP
jgi:hypothetical protein